MSEKPAETSEPLARPKSFWRRWGWQIMFSAAIALVVLGWYASRHGQVAGFVILPDTGKDSPFKLVIYLPRLGRLEDFRENQEPARAICRKLGLPEFPDISDLDPDGQRQFHVAIKNIRLRPKDHDQYGTLGQLYEAQKFLDLAVRLYERAIAMAPDDYEWHYALALRLLNDGEAKPAEAEFERATQLNPDYAPVWMRRAWQAQERGDMETAVAFANRYIALRPEDPLGYVQRAQIQLELDRWDDALESLDRATALGPIGKQGHRILSSLHRYRGENEDAAFHAHMYAHRAPGAEMDDPIALTVLRLETFRDPIAVEFDGLVRSKRYQEALHLEEELVAKYEDHPTYGQICGKLAECYRHLGHHQRALQYAQRTRDAMPQQAAPYAALAITYLDSGNLDAALKEANKTLEIDSSLTVGLYARGRTRIGLAIRDMVQQRHLPPELRQTDPKSLVAQAMKDLERCVKAEPVNPAYLAALATGHGMLQDYDQADKHLATALRVLEYEHASDPGIVALKKKAQARQSFWPQR